MGRGYKRKTDKIDAQVFQLAVLDIKNGKSLRETALKFNIPRTLLRHKRANDNIAGTEISSASTSTETALTINDIQIRGTGRLTVSSKQFLFLFSIFIFFSIFFFFQVFNKEQEKSLKEYLLHCSDIFFGMTSRDARSLAYQFACKLHIEIPENWKED